MRVLDMATDVYLTRLHGSLGLVNLYEVTLPGNI